MIGIHSILLWKKRREKGYTWDLVMESDAARIKRAHKSEKHHGNGTHLSSRLPLEYWIRDVIFRAHAGAPKTFQMQKNHKCNCYLSRTYRRTTRREHVKTEKKTVRLPAVLAGFSFFYTSLNRKDSCHFALHLGARQQTNKTEKKPISS